MLQLDIPYIIARTFPEGILVVLAGFILLDTKVSRIKLLKMGLLLGAIVTFIRMLPINFGVHTVLAMMMYWLIISKISGAKTIQTIITTLKIWIALVLSEGIYLGVATWILNLDYEVLTTNEGFEGAIKTLPSLVIFMLIVIIIKLVSKKIRGKYE